MTDPATKIAERAAVLLDRDGSLADPALAELTHRWVRVRAAGAHFDCDDCGTPGPRQDDLRAAYDAAWNDGWIAFDSGPVYCPDCRSRRNSEASA